MSGMVRMGDAHEGHLGDLGDIFTQDREVGGAQGAKLNTLYYIVFTLNYSSYSFSAYCNVRN